MMRLFPEAPQPFVAGRCRASLGFGRRRHRPPQSQNPIDEQPPALHRQLRPRMSHESLLVRGLVPVEQGGSHFVNNLLGNYS